MFLSGVQQGLVLGLIPFSNFVNDLDINIKSPLIKVVDCTKTGGVVNSDQDRQSSGSPGSRNI